MSVNPMVFLWLVLGLFAVVALAMCAVTAAALEHAGEPRHRRLGPSRLATAWHWLLSWLVYTEPQQLWAAWDRARGWVAKPRWHLEYQWLVRQYRAAVKRDRGQVQVLEDAPGITWAREAIASTISAIPPTHPADYRGACYVADRCTMDPACPHLGNCCEAEFCPPIDAATITQRAAQYRQAMTDAERWPDLQPRWSESTGEFAALIDATGGA